MQEMQETQGLSLGWADALEKEMATLFQYFYLENPMDRGAWLATVHGVAKESDTILDYATTSFTNTSINSGQSLKVFSREEVT